MKFKELFSKNPKKDDNALNEDIKSAQLILPVEIISNLDMDDIEDGDLIECDEGLCFNIIKIVNEKGEVFIPLYSSDEQIPEPTSTVDIYAENLAEIIGDNHENISGVVINPFSNYSVELEMDSFLNLFKD